MADIALSFNHAITSSDPLNQPVVIIGQLPHLLKLKYEDVERKLAPRVSAEVFSAAVASLQPNPTDSVSMYLNCATIAALPTKSSRHNTPSRAHSIPKLVRTHMNGGDQYILIVCNRLDVFASGCAVARAFPLFSSKSSDHKSTEAIDVHTVTVEFLLADDGSPLTKSDMDCIQDAAAGIRSAARIVDMPCNIMHTDAFVQEIKNVGSQLGIQPVIIRGTELRDKGFGGIYGVGKAAVHPPALAILSHTPSGASKTIAWVGKGIVYDTGGLSIKGKTAMPGMKRDCGGAAAILGAFYAVVKQGFTENLHALFCLAENAVGPDATRPDDIHTMYSGKTVEINNTDAEGRLVLADGVAYADKNLNADIILDMATLTGAQGIATGRYHAAVLTNNDEWEVMCTKAGKLSGDLVHPMPYSPELHFPEFTSAVADMKNSVADRGNAQPSCAGLFIAAHLGFDYRGSWIHVDMASPVHSGERATGYGVALLSALFAYASRSPLLQSLAHSDVELLVNGSNNMSPANKKIKLAQ